MGETTRKPPPRVAVVRPKCSRSLDAAVELMLGPQLLSR
jgi:hypothetical protein